jgi:hypothetical protein
VLSLQPLGEQDVVHAVAVLTMAFASCLELKSGVELTVAHANAVRTEASTL